MYGIFLKVNRSIWVTPGELHSLEPGGVTQERDCMYLYNMIPYVQIKEQGLFILFTFYFIKIKNNTVGKLPIHYTERKLLCF